MPELFTILLIAISLICIAFFAGYEIAFVNANRLSIELKKKQGKNSGIILSKFIDHRARFIGTCLIGVNLFTVIYGLLFSTMLKSSFWNPLHLRNDYVKLVFDITLSGTVLLLFGEFIPKAIFRARNDSLLSLFAPLANTFFDLFQWITNFFVSISLWILKYLFNVRVHDKREAFSGVDLEYFYQRNKEQDDDNNELNELYKNALTLPQVKIRQCLVPRTEIEGVEINTPIEEVIPYFISTRLAKLVVYADSIDNIVGYIHQLDLFKKPANIKSILLTIPAVPESMSAIDLMSKFTRERKSIAWVVDEFGGTAGIVTMEDVLEEIFGEIRDEYDEEEFVEKQLAEDEFIFSGRLELDYLNEKYHFEFPDDESETLSGYIIQRHETIPKFKEVIIIDHYQFDVLNVSDTRIEMVKMKLLR
jgi:CBS domain containing-hemolysin-like protein